MKNAYEIRGEVTAIIIVSPKYGRQEALISTSKLERANELVNTWLVGWNERIKSFYVQGSMPRENGKQKTIMLHRWITNAPNGLEVDHRNHDTLDNTDDNLRVCTISENNQNQKGAMSNNKSSGIRGVTWDKNAKKWKSYVTVQRKIIHLGYFTEITEAERAAIEARAKYMPYSQEAEAM